MVTIKPVVEDFEWRIEEITNFTYITYQKCKADEQTQCSEDPAADCS